MAYSKGKSYVTQSELAKMLNFSQQSISRKLKELEDDKLIVRIISKEGEIIRLTEEGERFLSSCLSSLKDAILSLHSLEIKGNIVSGLGEGKIFLSMDYYKNHINKVMGFDPYPGTLNIIIYDKLSLENRLLLDSSPSLIVPEYKQKDRVLGAVRLYPASINKLTPAAVVIPLRTIHPKSVIEVISPFHLREKLNLKDGNEVTIEVYV
ncbi:CTP-dependent riboflavin kinase [Saccharolobus islandicus]|nr:CTP-dependent riboflavin kinase [Sulfolobus islandicus]